LCSPARWCCCATCTPAREKVLTSKGFWGAPESLQYLGKADKDDIVDQVLLVRDAPTEEIYKEREAACST
jgi:hypothetical protein